MASCKMWRGRMRQQRRHECTYLCTRVECGDGLLAEDEECDDGNRVQNDRCTNNCLIPDDRRCQTTRSVMRAVAVSWGRAEMFDAIMRHTAMQANAVLGAPAWRASPAKGWAPARHPDYPRRNRPGDTHESQSFWQLLYQRHQRSGKRL